MLLDFSAVNSLNIVCTIRQPAKTFVIQKPNLWVWYLIAWHTIIFSFLVVPCYDESARTLIVLDFIASCNWAIFLSLWIDLRFLRTTSIYFFQPHKTIVSSDSSTWFNPSVCVALFSRMLGWNCNASVSALYIAPLIWLTMLRLLVRTRVEYLS